MDLEKLKADLGFYLRSAKEIAEKAVTEGRSLTDAENESIKGWEKKIEETRATITKIEDRVKTVERLGALEAELTKPEPRATITPVSAQDDAHTVEARTIEVPPHMLRVGRLRAFKDEVAAYRSGQWLLAHMFGNRRAKQWCKDNMRVEERAQYENTDTAGGYLVPPEFAQTIIDLREEYGVFRQLCRVVPMASDKYTQPRRTGGVSS